MFRAACLPAVLALFLAGCTTKPASSPPAAAQLVTEIYVRDVAKSQVFYEKLGFTTTHTEPTFRELQFGSRKLFLSQRRAAPPALPGANLRIGVPDVDAVYARVQKMSIKILTPIKNHEWGERDFLIADPDGFGLRFTSLLPGGKW